jgi:hypothetical protein
LQRLEEEDWNKSRENSNFVREARMPVMTVAPQKQAEESERARDLAISVAGELLRGSELVLDVPADVYAELGARRGSVGSHIRHNLDFVNCLIRGLSTGRVDYTSRERDERVETEKEYAVQMVSALAERLVPETVSFRGGDLLVRSEIDGSLWHRSSLERELEFLHSHTVHHYALIAEKLRARGIDTPESFGVAPSTLGYWRSAAAKSTPGSGDELEK